MTVSLANSKAFSKSRNTTVDLLQLTVERRVARHSDVPVSFVYAYTEGWSGPVTHWSRFRTTRSIVLHKQLISEIGR